MIIFHVVKLIDILRVDKEALLLIVVHSVYVVVISALGSALGLVGGVRWYTTDDHPSWARNRSAINAGPESAIIRETLLLHGTSTSIEVLRVNICLTLCHPVGTISVWLIFVFVMSAYGLRETFDCRAADPKIVDGGCRAQVYPDLPEIVIVHKILDFLVFTRANLYHLLRCYLI